MCEEDAERNARLTRNFAAEPGRVENNRKFLSTDLPPAGLVLGELGVGHAGFAFECEFREVQFSKDLVENEQIGQHVVAAVPIALKGPADLVEACKQVLPLGVG